MKRNLLPSGKESGALLRRIQHGRLAVQLLIMGLLIAGLYASVVRPALIVIFVLTFLAGNFFCGWICPFGTAQDLLGRLGALFVKRKLKMPYSIQKYAQYFRYILAAALMLLGVGAAAEIFPINAYRTFLGTISGNEVQAVALAVVGIFLLSSLFVERAFCNYFCSEGIRYGLASLTRIFTIKRDAASCVNCKRCDRVCPGNIEVSAGLQVRNALCVNCFQCIGACPTEGTLSYGLVSLKHMLPSKQSTASIDTSQKNVV